MAKHLTVDVCILMDGAGIGTSGDRATCKAFVERIDEQATLGIAVDSRDKILTQYRQKLSSTPLLRMIWKWLDSPGKVCKVRWKNLGKNVRVELRDDHHFDCNAGE